MVSMKFEACSSDSWVPVSSQAVPRPRSSTRPRPRAGSEARGDLEYVIVVEIQPGDGVVRAWLRGLLLDTARAAGLVELDHAVALRVAQAVREYGSPLGLLVGPAQLLRQPMTVEQVVAEHERGRIRTHERAPDRKGLGEPTRRRLLGVLQRQAPLAAIAEQTLERGQVGRGRDQQVVADPGEHQRSERVVHHRLVVNPQQLLSGPGPGA